MSQKKNYSRSFIILQENEKGYEISSDKLPTGYAKVEIKNGKCKISFYVQNLKKMSKPYNMLLVCDKKNTKKLIDLGKIDIDEYGRSEISREFNENDIAESGISVDRVVGASIAQVIEDNVIAVMSGFNASDISDSWKTYPVAQVKKDDDETSKNSESIELSRQDNVRKDKTHGKTLKGKGDNLANVFDEYEKKVQDKADEQGEKVSEIKEAKSENTEINKEKIIKRNEDENDNAVVNSAQENINEVKNSNVEKSDIAEEDNIENDNQSSYQSVNEDEEDSEEFPKGKIGKFFRSLTNGLEDLGDVFPDVKRCQWYKISSEYPQNMFGSQSYNRYSVVYYPMLMYYPYIEKYGHYLLGYKCDKNGNMKYIVYAVPGTKKRVEQPFGGKTGFVSWIPLVDGDEKEDSLGYWLMFYDFKNSTIAVPKR